MLDLYRSADVLINVRLTQTLNTKYFFPSKLMECLASGVPVISTCPGHVAEEFGRLAYLLREETPEALAAAIRRVAATRPGRPGRNGPPGTEVHGGTQDLGLRRSAGSWTTSAKPSADMSDRIRILVLTSCYLPGYKAGGPVRSDLGHDPVARR